MLNISKNRVNKEIDSRRFRAFERLELPAQSNVRPRLLVGLLILLLIFLFLPWTQNVRGKGYITTRLPSERPQSIPALIDGRVVAWYAREGMLVQEGDTLLQLAEVKDDYLDPDFLLRAEEQLQAKAEGAEAYREKISQLNAQIQALENNRQLKLQQVRNYIRQARLKIQADSMELTAARTQLAIADQQFERMETLYAQGLKSRKDLEDRRLKQQEAQAKLIKAETDYLASQNKLLNEQTELNVQQAEYSEKIAKARSERAEANSALQTAEAELAKLRNQLGNYRQRQGYYFVQAPQDGYISRTSLSGIGETVKAGEELLRIVPKTLDLAVEMYIAPLDLPLMHEGQHVRLVFDGWPAMVFSGWPNASVGTYGGEVIGIDNMISPNGKFRVLVAPDPQDVPWPQALRQGSGVQAMALLEDVPLGYELWRRINGFPPNFYVDEEQKEKPKAEKK